MTDRVPRPFSSDFLNSCRFHGCVYERLRETKTDRDETLRDSPVKLDYSIGKIASFKSSTDLDAKKHALVEITFFTIVSVCVNIIFYI